MKSKQWRTPEAGVANGHDEVDASLGVENGQRLSEK